MENKSKRNPGAENSIFKKYYQNGAIELSISPLLYFNPSEKYGTHLRNINLKPFTNEWFGRKVSQMGYSQFDILLGDKSDSNLLEVSSRFGQFWLTNKLVEQDTDSNANLITSPGIAIIQDIAQDTDLVYEYRVKRYRLSAKIRLKSQAAIRQSYAISVLPSANLALSLENQAIKVLNIENNEYFYINMPNLEIHKSGFISEFVSGSDNIYYTIENGSINGKSVKIIKKNLTNACVTALNAAFENGADFIDIDPEYTMQPAAAAGIDTSILKENDSYVDTNFGSDATLYISNRYPDMQKWYAGLLKFNDLTNYGNITSAVLSIFQSAQNNSYNYTWTGYAYRLLVDFNETEATWNIRKTGTSWNTAGANGDGTDINTTSVGSWTGNAAYAVGTEKEITLNATVVGYMADGTYGNDGFKLLPESGGNYSSYYGTSDHTSTSLHPKLWLETNEATTSSFAAKKIIEFDVVSSKPATTAEITSPQAQDVVSGALTIKGLIKHHKSTDSLTVKTYYRQSGEDNFTEIDTTTGISGDAQNEISHTWNTNNLTSSFSNNCELKIRAYNSGETIDVSQTITVYVHNSPHVITDYELLDENKNEITDSVLRTYLSTEDSFFYVAMTLGADVNDDDQTIEVLKTTDQTKILVSTTNYTEFYKWSGSAYVVLSSSTDSLKAGDKIAVKIPSSWAVAGNDIQIRSY